MSWNPSVEDTVCAWGEKAAGLRWMHEYQERRMKLWGNTLAMWSLSLTMLGSTLSLGFAQYEPAQIWAMYSVGVLGMLASLIQSVKHYYNIDYVASEHAMASKKFGAFYRFISNQLGIEASERRSFKEVQDWALMGFEQAQQDAPIIDNHTICAFRKKYADIETWPDIASKSFEIVITGR